MKVPTNLKYIIKTFIKHRKIFYYHKKSERIMQNIEFFFETFHALLLLKFNYLGVFS
jgi:hypothetical protein